MPVYSHKFLDVSEWTDHVDWKRAVNSTYPVQIGFAKATRGIDYVNSEFGYHFAEMKQNGIIAGAHHLFDPSPETTYQDEFQNITEALEKFGFDKSKDIVAVGVKEKTTTGAMEKKFTNLLNLLLTNQFRVFLLTNQDLWKYGLYRAVRCCNPPLSIHHYHVNLPMVPCIWYDQGWKMWNYKSDHSKPVINSSALYVFTFTY